jgi:enterochelin esterase-like enzyme
MARKSTSTKPGQLLVETFDSKILAGNPLNDPTERQVHIYLPHAYQSKRHSNRRFPVLYDLVGYTGAGPSHTNWRNFEENVPEKLDRLIGQGKMPPCMVVFPDCFTALGGNQYVNSSAIGRYADYLTKEVVGFVDKHTRSLAERNHRGCFGKSSGGYGAMVHGMKYPQYWGAIANHSGDAYFDFVYKAEWPAVLTALQRFAKPAPNAGKQSAKFGQSRPGYDDGRIRRFLDHCWQTTQLSGRDITVLMMICMAASYDPDPKAPNGFRLPYDLHTGKLIERRWQAWLKHDPIHMLGKYKSNLQKLQGIFIDCGWRDQYHIHYGSRQLSQNLHKLGINHRYEEFDGTHSGIDHRMDVSLPFLAKALT